MDWNRVEVGDCREILRTLPEGVFRTCVTSPPYSDSDLVQSVRAPVDAFHGHAVLTFPFKLAGERTVQTGLRF